MPQIHFYLRLQFSVLSKRYETGGDISHHQLGRQELGDDRQNNDATLTSAVLDRVLHHAEAITIEGRSCRVKDQIEEN